MLSQIRSCEQRVLLLHSFRSYFVIFSELPVIRDCGMSSNNYSISYLQSNSEPTSKGEMCFPLSALHTIQQMYVLLHERLRKNKSMKSVVPCHHAIIRHKNTILCVI